MNAEILCVGTELVLGDILNTNAQYLSKKLASQGINVYYQSSVGDNPDRIIKALKTAVERSNIIIFTGGLGPTADDITIETVANALNIELEKNEEAYQNIVRYFEIAGKEMTNNNEKQAFLPKGCVVLPNEVGTAPGCVIEKGNQCIAFMPGVPHELERMFEKHLSKYLEKYSDGVILSKFLHIYGIGESKIDEMAKDFINGENPSVAPYAKLGETELRVTAKATNKSDAEFLLNETTLTLSSMFGDHFYGYDDITLESVVVKLLKAKGKTIATAESCTAGYISKRITDISGASKVFKMGVTTYSNESKTEELSVPSDLIELHGAVSSEVAACMAKGVRLKSGADIGVSITGIAGPKSDESKKPIGLSYIGISDESGEYVIKSMKGPKPDREYIRYTSASEALNFVRLFLLERLETLEIKEFNAVLLNEMVEEVKEEEETKPKAETKPKDSIMPSYLIGIQDELLKQEEEKKINLVGDEDAQKLQNTPKYTDKSKEEINIKFDETDYAPVESTEFEAFDAALEVYEKNLVKEHQKGSFKNFFIRSTDGKEEITRKIVLYIAIIVFVISIGWSVYFFVNPAIQQYKISGYAEEIDKANQDDHNYYSDKVNPKFLNLLSKNEDTIGWISIDGTKIDYPVLKSDEPEFYLRRGFDKSFSREGSVFADENSSIEYKNESQNIVLYGHHMISTGTMFKDLDYYTNVKFYKKHPTIIFDSLFRDSEYKIFAVFITNSLAEQDNGNFYDYTKSEFENQEEFIAWINEAKLRSMITTNVDVIEGDEILTLQTCNDSFESKGSKARLVVMARRVRENEPAVDTSSAIANPNPKFPQMWYDVNGQVNPFYSVEEGKVIIPEETTKTSSTTKNTTTSTTTTTTTAPVTVAVNNNQTSTSQSSSTTKKPTTTTKAPTSTTKTTVSQSTSESTIATTQETQTTTNLRDVINKNE